jgi:hypothetical protein
MSDKMVPLAIIISRSEAVVMASMLEAAGIITHVGALHHASVEINSLALGHYRLMVPEGQHEEASELVAESFAKAEWQFSQGLQTATIRLLLAKFFATFGVILFTAHGPWPVAPSSFAIPFFVFLGTPVNPQGRSEYFLASPDGDPA